MCLSLREMPSAAPLSKIGKARDFNIPPTPTGLPRAPDSAGTQLGCRSRRCDRWDGRQPGADTPGRAKHATPNAGDIWTSVCPIRLPKLGPWLHSRFRQSGTCLNYYLPSGNFDTHPVPNFAIRAKSFEPTSVLHASSVFHLRSSSYSRAPPLPLRPYVLHFRLTAFPSPTIDVHASQNTRSSANSGSVMAGGCGS
ncbi:hypothetical protein CIHG_07722 [Coccidioides immitis H538.4]|uniref:Uncharacterized protein n=2 Tax=Coccidioides immitis TaxID=5501 RepID=A0A0J8UR25_COCIT|nr:hypothetical protein CIRG_04195 [Coccidioides immitis RMSCC 2394]KMU90038.1 hypothetical protein CIHG_07722 [Coccidioides immitis H538.4]